MAPHKFAPLRAMALTQRREIEPHPVSAQALRCRRGDRRGRLTRSRRWRSAVFTCTYCVFKESTCKTRTHSVRMLCVRGRCIQICTTVAGYCCATARTCQNFGSLRRAPTTTLRLPSRLHVTCALRRTYNTTTSVPRTHAVHSEPIFQNANRPIWA